MNHDPATDLACGLIARHEPFRASPHHLPSGDLIQGYGCRATPGGFLIRPDDAAIDEGAAEDWLRILVADIVARVRLMANYPVTDEQVAALASLAFSVGTDRLRSSLLMLEVNRGNLDEATRAFGALVFDRHGAYHPEMAAWRRAEAALFAGIGALVDAAEDRLTGRSAP